MRGLMHRLDARRERSQPSPAAGHSGYAAYDFPEAEQHSDYGRDDMACHGTKDVLDTPIRHPILPLRSMIVPPSNRSGRRQRVHWMAPNLLSPFIAQPQTQQSAIKMDLKQAATIVFDGDLDLSEELVSMHDTSLSRGNLASFQGDNWIGNDEMVMCSNAKYLTHDTVIACFEPYLYPLDVSYQNVNEAKVILWLVGYKKEMVDVDLKCSVLSCQTYHASQMIFIMKFMDNWSNGGLSKSIDVASGFYRFNFETPTFNAIAAISWLRRERWLLLRHRATALLSHLSPVRQRLAERQGISEVQAKVCPEEVTISEPIFPTLVRAFYSRVTYGHGGPIISTSICRILDIAPVGLRAFLIDSIMIGRHIDVGYLMMMHMMACCESSTRDAGVDLSREQDFEAPSSYDTYDEQLLGRMKFEKALDGSWIRRAE
ncbi:hypothetical protein AAG906_038517 [Vitis piasezkii]